MIEGAQKREGETISRSTEGGVLALALEILTTAETGEGAKRNVLVVTLQGQPEGMLAESTSGTRQTTAMLSGTIAHAASSRFVMTTRRVLTAVTRAGSFQTSWQGGAAPTLSRMTEGGIFVAVVVEGLAKGAEVLGMMATMLAQGARGLAALGAVIRKLVFVGKHLGAFAPKGLGAVATLLDG